MPLVTRRNRTLFLQSNDVQPSPLTASTVNPREAATSALHELVVRAPAPVPFAVIARLTREREASGSLFGETSPPRRASPIRHPPNSLPSAPPSLVKRFNNICRFSLVVGQCSGENCELVQNFVPPHLSLWTTQDRHQIGRSFLSIASRRSKKRFVSARCPRADQVHRLGNILITQILPSRSTIAVRRSSASSRSPLTVRESSSHR